MGLGLADVVATAAAVADAPARNDKVAALAELLGRADRRELSIVIGLLVGDLRQGRIGVGWSTVGSLDIEPVGEASIEVSEVDHAFDEIAFTSGDGSAQRRHDVLAALWARSTAAEQAFLGAVLTGGLRQGALEGVMVTAVAKAAGVPVASVRRGTMLSGDLGETAQIALGDGRAALDSIGLRPGRAIGPMLASTSASVADAMGEFDTAVVQAKLDGIRLQVHRSGDGVRLYTRNLNDVTERLPDVVALTRSLDGEPFVLDGELIGVGSESPELFQDTASTFSSGGGSGRVDLVLSVFDALHLDGEDLIDLPLETRLARLEARMGHVVLPTITTADVAEAEAFEAEILDGGHEGVMVKDVSSPYAAGRRGKAWRKVKPVHTFDLVVLGAEWGHGRRTGWLSNLLLGARDGDDFVMVGKTFKGLTDAMLEWQTAALKELEAEPVDGVPQDRAAITVFTRPELVVEIAIDGVQRSTTYPGGLALRFARVKAHRPDKIAAESDTIDTLRSML